MGYVPAIMIAMNIAYSAFAYPAGVAADRLSARTLVVFGLCVLLAADILLASVIAGALWGAFGPSATFIAGALLAAIAAIGLFLYRSKSQSPTACTIG